MIMALTWAFLKSVCIKILLGCSSGCSYRSEAFTEASAPERFCHPVARQVGDGLDRLLLGRAALSGQAEVGAELPVLPAGDLLKRIERGAADL